MTAPNLNILLVGRRGRCGQSLFSGEVNVYYKSHSYSISAGTGTNWRRTKNRV